MIRQMTSVHMFDKPGDRGVQEGGELLKNILVLEK